MNLTNYLHTIEQMPRVARPRRFTFPFSYVPHPWAEAAANETMAAVRRYMSARPESELHRQGKMFGVLVVQTAADDVRYLRAFSAMLDGAYDHPGFVPPVFDLSRPDGYFKQEEAAISAINKRLQVMDDAAEATPFKAERKQRSQALQRWMFAQYRMLNQQGEERDLLQIFEGEKPILTEEDFFLKRARTAASLPPSGAGECCAPKLLQIAFREGLTPLCMAEFWMGASPEKELRQEGLFYPACMSRCRPILAHMLQGIALDADPLLESSHTLAEQAEVLYEDDALLVVNKPAGLLTAPGAEGAFSLQDWAAERIGSTDIHPVHRLDMDTSGIVILAKSLPIYKRLQQQFLRRDIEKRYEAVVRPLGPAPETNGRCTLPLLPDPFDRPRQMVNRAHGKEAITCYTVQECRTDGSLLLYLYPHTGRTHQLRVHCAHREGLHAPILGDRLYGDSRTAPRLMLHAAEIRFTHPLTNEEMHIVCSSGW